MKAVLMSIQPKWCELIASGKKTVEVRKTNPKLETPFKVYIYCTASNVHECLMVNEYGTKLIIAMNYKTAIPCGGWIGNGKIIGEFVCDGITDFSYDKKYDNLTLTEMSVKSQLSTSEIEEYANGQYMVYGWHISDLVIYNKPKELREFFKVGHSEYCKSEWERREKLRKKINKYNENTGSEVHLNTDSDFVNILKMLSPFKIKRPPQSWCYVEELGAEQ